MITFLFPIAFIALILILPLINEQFNQKKEDNPLTLNKLRLLVLSLAVFFSSIGLIGQFIFLFSFISHPSSLNSLQLGGFGTLTWGFFAYISSNWIYSKKNNPKILKIAAFLPIISLANSGFFAAIFAITVIMLHYIIICKELFQNK